MSSRSIEVGGISEEQCASAGRARVHEVALRLFAEYGVSGTSLQAIVEDMGVSKAAVYHDYKTKDENLLGVNAPLVLGSEVLSRCPGAPWAPHTGETLLTGLVELVIEARKIYRVVAIDPSYEHLQNHHPQLRSVGEQLVELRRGPDPYATTTITVSLFLSSLVGPFTTPPAPTSMMTTCARPY